MVEGGASYLSPLTGLDPLSVWRGKGVRFSRKSKVMSTENTPPTPSSAYTRSVRITPKQAKRISRIVEVTSREGLRVPGPVNSIRPKESHVLRLALEIGLPQVLEAIRELHNASARKPIRDAVLGAPERKGEP